MMDSKLEVDTDFYLHETLLEHGRNTDHNGIVLGAWKNEFFDCFDDCVPNGFMAILCPVVSMAQISKRLGLAPYSLVIGVYVGLYLLGHLSASLEFPLIIYIGFAAGLASVMWVAIPIGILILRVNIRELFSIPGNIAEDVLLAFVCGPCTITQMVAHVGSYEPGTCSFGPRSTLGGYVHQ
ncbi:putative transmembrane protein [Phytophthora cinnamomi]|uniref:putative transmembrane protein n=1 Tax=Phytophthora cinnamomi TaxID=4785 RepID=UPI0035598687|nr:putative transmembrane protein [Phytophthora cinnamomi]